MTISHTKSESQIYTHSHFGVYALVFKDNNKREILLIKKARGPYTGKLDLPGGSLEPTELIEEALHRELLEETGCKVSSSKEIGCVSTLYKYIENEKKCILRHLGVLFIANVTGRHRHEPDGEDSNGCMWVSVSNLDHLKVTPFVLEAVKRSGITPAE